MPVTASKLFRVAVSKDRLTATLTLNGPEPPDAGASAEEILAELKTLGLVGDDRSRQAIERFAAAVAGGGVPEPVIAARGEPPQHDQHGQIEKLYKEASQPQEGSEQSDGDRQSHYDRSSIVTVKEGEQIVRLVPPVPGRNGVDVFGKEIARKLAREVELRLGNNVRQEGQYVIATCDGKLEWQGDKVDINPKLEIRGDVDFSVGNIDFAGAVVIHKNILDLFRVSSGGDIAVHGMAEAAEVHAGGDLEIIGGMTGKDKGVFCAGRNIKSKYITNATVRAGGNIEVRTEVLQCQIICCGRLIVENGPLVAGRVVATGGAKLKQLGSDANVKTLVEIGIDEELRTKCEQVAPEVKAHRQKAEKVRKIVEPLLQNQKHLTNQQREKATELLYQASELEEQADNLIEELRQVAHKAQNKGVAEIEITGTIYPGVTIRFPRVQSTISQPLAGPLKIMPRQVRGILKVVAVDGKTGAVHDLGASSDPDELWDTLDELLGSPAETTDPDNQPE